MSLFLSSQISQRRCSCERGVLRDYSALFGKHLRLRAIFCKEADLLVRLFCGNCSPSQVCWVVLNGFSEHLFIRTPPMAAYLSTSLALTINFRTPFLYRVSLLCDVAHEYIGIVFFVKILIINFLFSLD